MSSSMAMSSHKLTAGQLRWMLDLDVPSGAASQDPNRSLPERVWDLHELSSEDQSVIQRIDEITALPTPLLKDYDTIALQSRVQLPPGVQTYMKDFVERLTRDITIQTNLRFQLPTPLFRNDEHFHLETFIPQHRIDLANIAYDAADGNRRLTLAQDQDAFSKLKQTGIYTRGDFDIVFQWYPGRDKIRRWKYEAWAESLYQWSVDLPSTLIGRDQSVALGLSQFISGLSITANRLTGLIPTKFPKYRRSEIDGECAKEYFQWLQKSEGFTLMASEVTRQHHGDPSLTHRFPVLFEHPTRGILDFRTSVPPIRTRLRRILDDARQVTETRIGAQRMAVIASWSRTTDESDAIEKYLKMWCDAYLSALERRRDDIDRLSSLPDLTGTVLKEERARMLVAPVVRERQQSRKDTIDRQLQLWKVSHPLKATSAKFEARELAAVSAKVAEPISLSVSVRDALMENDLNELALLIDSQDEFQRSEVLKELKKGFEAARSPGVVNLGFLKVPSRWTVKRRQRARGEAFYELQLLRTVQVRSSVPLWRWGTFGLRYCSWIWNSSFFLVNKASIAIRRWNLFRLSFEIRLASVNHTTGEFETTSIRTLRGRLSTLLDWKVETIGQARRGEHIIRLRDGVYLDMCWAHFWTSVGVGLGGALVVCFTGLETLVVVSGASLAILTAPVWSLIGNVGRCLFNAFVYDLDLDIGKQGKAPLFRNLFGLPNMLLSTVRGVFHVLKGATVAVGGEIRHAWNRTWHFLMTALLKRAEVPTRAEGFFWSTSGPGMKNPFVVIDADTAILALLAFLSQQELVSAQQEMYSDLREPRRCLEQRVQEDSGRTMRLQDIHVVANALSKAEASHRDDLNRFGRLAETERQYRALLQGVRGNPRIRMIAHELDAFTPRATHVVKKFYLERYFTRETTSDIVKFWESRNLAPGDWQGLMDCIMSDIFTDEMVVPFEAASDDLVVDANRVIGLERVVQEALEEHGVVTGTSTDYSIGNPVRRKMIPRAPSFVDLPVLFLPQPTDA